MNVMILIKYESTATSKFKQQLKKSAQYFGKENSKKSKRLLSSQLEEIRFIFKSEPKYEGKFDSS